MATIMEWGGCAPRGTPGPRIILGAGAGPDGVAQEVTAGLSEIERQGKRGEALARLAVVRYGSDPTPSWLMQMHLAGFSSTARQTYYDQVHALHLRLLQALTRRAEVRKQLAVRRAGQTQSVLKVASKLRRAN